MSKGTPWVGFGNEQLDAAPELPDKVSCPGGCGTMLNVDDLKGISCVHCDKCGESYLVGIHGKDIRGTKGTSGEVDIDTM